MSDMSTWKATGVKIGPREQYGTRNQNLVIEAEPTYGNCKRWKGEFWFALTPEQLDDLKKIVDHMSQKARLVEVAHSELEAIKKVFREEYQDKLANVLTETGLTEDDLPYYARNL